jgi:hypothetical protein
MTALLEEACCEPLVELPSATKRTERRLMVLPGLRRNKSASLERAFGV